MKTSNDTIDSSILNRLSLKRVSSSDNVNLTSGFTLNKSGDKC